MKRILLTFLMIISTFLSLKPYKQIEGNIINITNNTFTILTNKGTIYTFNKPNNFNNIINDNIKIKYENKISDFRNIQNITIKKIENIPYIKYNQSNLFKNYYIKATEKVKYMTTEEKIGQLLLVRVPEKEKIETIKKYNIGGYILFGRDVANKTKEELIKEIQDYQQNSKIGLLIAIDEEGGTVTRLSQNKKIISSPFLSSQELYKINGFDEIKKDTIEKNKILYELGINLNLAPVADVTTNEKAYMYKRSFGQNAPLTSEYIKTVIENTDYKVSYTLKHFPGYGNNVDTHKGIAIDERTYENFINNDFKPFIEGIKNNVQAILFSHNYMTCVDEKNPSSLSPNVHNVLKNELNYKNITITDDISMNGLSNIENKYTKALLSGNNILIVTDYKKAYTEIQNSLENKQISEELINYLVTQNIAWKYYKQIIKD